MQKRPQKVLSLPGIRGSETTYQNADDTKRASHYSSPSEELTPILREVLDSVQREIGLQVDVEYSPNDYEILISRESTRCGVELTSIERDLVLRHLERDAKPFGLLDDLVRDISISDIIVSRYNSIQVQQGRRNVTTGLSFPSQEAYETFVEKLLLRANSTYSTRVPIADGVIGGFARIHTVHRAITENGPYLTIRLNRFSSVTTQDLLRHGLAPKEILKYLELMVQSGQTLLIVGEVGTGKTTLARALAACIPSEESILVVEDTPEIKLEHPHVRYVRTRTANTEGEGRVAPSEVIRGGMRMAMNRIVFGEIRDAEAAEAFIDVCASGHPGLSTIHGKSAQDAIVRLSLFLGRAQRGVGKDVIYEQLATAVSAIVHMDVCPISRARRIMEVREIGPVGDGVLRQKEIFRYEPRNKFPSWTVVHPLSNHREALESASAPLSLSDLPKNLELPDEYLFQEAQRIKR